MNKMTKMLMGSALVVGLAAAGSFAGTLNDSRDGKSYQTVKVGNQEWMAENLGYNQTYYSQQDALEACPAGWRLPSLKDFTKMLNTVVSKKNRKKDAWKNALTDLNRVGLNMVPADYEENEATFFDPDDNFKLKKGMVYWTNYGCDSEGVCYESRAIVVDDSKATAMGCDNEGAGCRDLYKAQIRCIKK